MKKAYNAADHSNCFLHDDLVCLRKLSLEESLESYLKFINDTKNLVWTDVGVFPFTKEDLRSHIQSFPGLLLSIFNMDKVHVGNVHLSHMDHRNRQAELGVLIAHEHQNMGYASCTAKLVIGHAFETMNLHRIYLSVVDKNGKARKMWEKLGFVKEGVERGSFYFDMRYHDAVRYSMLASEYVSLKKRW